MSGGEPDPRPRPQYGEYATPEEQRARIQQPDVTDALDTGRAPDAGAAARADGPGGGAGAWPGDRTGAGPGAEPAADGAGKRSARGRTIDRIATIGLLAYGFITMIGAIPSMIDYGAYAATMLETMGVDAELSDPAAGRPWAVGASLVLAAGWLATAALSAWRLRRDRVAWWVPLAGGILFTFVAGMLVAVPLMSDPAVWRALQGTAGG